MMSDNVTEQDDFCPMHGESVAHVKVAGGEPGCTCPSAPPASSNDVTITELDDGALVVQQIGLPDGVIYPEVAAALRARFASERMPDDVRALVEERDALAAVIEAIRRNWRTQKPELFHGMTKQIIDRAPADVLAEHDARIRAEVIDWLEAIHSNGALIWDKAREYFGTTKGADRG